MKKIEVKNEMKTMSKQKNVTTRIGEWLHKHTTDICCVLFVSLMCVGVAYADEADGAWTQIVELLTKWIRRIAWVVAGYGVFEVGMAQKEGDPGRRSSGFQIVAGGLIGVAAVTLIQNFAK